jgi:hypothetical protein
LRTTRRLSVEGFAQAYQTSVGYLAMIGRIGRACKPFRNHERESPFRMRQYQFRPPFRLFFEPLFCFLPVFTIALFLIFFLVFFTALASHLHAPFSVFFSREILFRLSSYRLFYRTEMDYSSRAFLMLVE